MYCKPTLCASVVKEKKVSIPECTVRMLPWRRKEGTPGGSVGDQYDTLFSVLPSRITSIVCTVRAVCTCNNGVNIATQNVLLRHLIAQAKP